MTIMTLERRPDGVAMLILDDPARPVNVLSREFFGDLRATLEEALADSSIRACVLASGKKDFVAGADIKQFFAISDAAEAEALSREGHALIDLVAKGGKPFVAALRGQTLGGGLEVALACRYRIAADDPSTVLALPEVTLGLLPGGGGTQRLPALVGLPAALPMMLTGKRVRVRKALRMGLVDELATPGGLEETAAECALALAEGRLSPKRRRRSLGDRLLETAPGRALVLRKARAEVAAKTRGLYPAPPAILECVGRGAKGTEAEYETESRLFGELVASPQAKGLLSLFLSSIELKKPPEGAEPKGIKRLAVLGGGFMGAGIASVSLKRVPVVVKDLSDEVLGRCARTIRRGLDKQVKSGAITPFDRDRLWARFHPATEYGEVAGADLVIEAVFEDLELKRKVLADLEGIISPSAVFASNTSALPIGGIAEGASHPERVLGMHYFSPVPKMPLLELVRAERTADWAVATARAFGVAQGKTVIVVKDGPGFYTTRILSPFLNEAMVLLEEGARIEVVDRSVKDFGYPVGPITLLDEVGIDVGAHVVREFGNTFADRGLGASDALPKLFDEGYLGRKNRKGFYAYPKKRKKGPKPVNGEVYTFFGGPARKEIAPGVIADRLGLLMVNEAVVCLQEGVISCPRDGDVGAVLGLGFPPFTGGPFRYADRLGLDKLAEKLSRLAEAHGERFQPAPLLLDMLQGGKTFYDTGKTAPAR